MEAIWTETEHIIPCALAETHNVQNTVVHAYKDKDTYRQMYADNYVLLVFLTFVSDE